MERIKTIFYFVENLDFDTYHRKWETREIADRTIIFSRKNKSIFAHGIQYSPMSTEDLKLIIQDLLDSGELVLPAATRDRRGAIRVGNGLSIGGEDDDILSVDFSNVDGIDGLLELIRALFDSAEILRATKERFGIIKIGKGLNVDENGFLNVDFSDLPEGSSVYASYTKYGVVKVEKDGGIIVDNGIISVDPDKFPDDFRGKPGEDGKDGRDGKSAYEIAVENGFTGTVEEWLASLKGQDGANGRDGRDGRDGTDGRNGTDGLNGRDGSDGKDGKDGVDGSDGADAVVDLEALKNEIIINIKHDINEENNWWNTWAELLINQAWERLLSDLDGNWNIIMHQSGWIEALNAYLQSVLLFTVLQDENRITLKDRFSEIQLTLDSISARVLQINGFFDANGNPLSLETAIAQMIAGIGDNEAFNSLVAAKVNENLANGQITSAISSLDMRVSDVEGELSATNRLVARVDNGSNVTLNLLKQLSDGTKAVTNLSSSYDIYEMNGKDYQYVTENGLWVYDIDDEGRAIPWKAIKLFYVDTAGNLSETIPANPRYKKNRIWDATLNDGAGDWVEVNVLDENNNPLYDMVGEMVYFQRNGDTGDLPHPNKNPSYILERELTHDANGELVWTGGGTPTNPKMLSDQRIAYHRARVRKTITLADLQLGANAEQAWTFLASLYSAFDGHDENIASTTQVANAKGAVIETMARHTCYIPKIENGTVLKDPNGNVYYQWERKEQNGTISIAWSTSDNGPDEQGTWTKSIKLDVKAGMTAVATEYLAQAGITSAIDDIVAYMGTCVTYDENTNTYTSTAKVSAENIILEGNTFITNLTANEAFINSLKTKDLGASHTLVAGGAGYKGITISPSPGGSGAADIRYGTLVENDGSISVYTPEIAIGNEYCHGCLSDGDNNLDNHNVVEISEFTGSGNSHRRQFSSRLGNHGLTVRYSLDIDTWRNADNSVDVYVTDQLANVKVQLGVVVTNYTANGSTVSSDMRLKDVVEDVNLTVEQIAKAPNFKYTFKGDSKNNVYVGTSAQYWLGILPETVNDSDEYLSLDYSRIAAVSVIQLAKEIVKLKAQNEELLNRIKVLENSVL